MKRNGKLILLLCLTVLWLGFIFVRSLMDAEASSKESGAILALLVRFFPFLTDHLIRKAAHFTEFFLLGVLLWADWRLLGRGPALLPLGAGLAAAAADETLQTFVPGRSGQLTDVLLDFSGAALAIGLLILFGRGRKRHGS